MVLEVQATQPTSFENDSELAFDFKLARDLGLTVGELRHKMSVLEYQQWVGFYLFEKKQRDYQIAMQEAEMNKQRSKRR